MSTSQNQRASFVAHSNHPLLPAPQARLQAAQVKVGQRILATDGCTAPRYGRAYGIRRTRFATTMRIKFDDYTFDELQSAQPITAHQLKHEGTRAIGYYVVLP